MKLRSLVTGCVGALAGVMSSTCVLAAERTDAIADYGIDRQHDYGYFRNHIRDCVNAKRTKLQILHSSDNESSFQDPNTLEPKILHYATVQSGLEKIARRECIPSLHLTAGDHTLPGPFYQAAAEVPEFGFRGLADIALYNAMGLAANGMGNHEFDGGINDFARMLDTANYPFIAVNLDFSNVQLADGVPSIRIGQDARNCRINRGKTVKSCWMRVGQSRVGLIGRAPADFFNVVRDPDTTLPGLDFVGGRNPADNQPLVSAVDQVLEQVALLEKKGIKRIILLDHAQDFTADPLSTSLLRGIDIIVAAGSTGFMAQPVPIGPFNLLRPEDTPEADYPTWRVDSEGNTVLVVNSDQQYRYVGNLIVTFDKQGHIVAVDERSGPVATTETAIAELENLLHQELTVPEEVNTIYASLQSTPLIQDAFTVIGTTTAPLNGNRADVRSRETNLGRLAADSTVWFARNNGFPTVDVALKNGGGIRDTITGPSIIRLTVEAALAFNNTLTVLDMTGAQLLAAMENAVSRVPALDGRFPQISGLQLDYDASQPGISDATELNTASRVQNLTINKQDGSVVKLVENGVVNAAALADSFVLATNSFTATGGDGYAAFPASVVLGATSTGEQLILEQYIQDALGGAVDLPEPLAAPRVVRLD